MSLIIRRKYAIEFIRKLNKTTGVDVKYMFGTMIEIPRAAIMADKMARERAIFLIWYK
jgi:phosphoenolpyruvate synthase/pyruvate phosphate dikinase